ncbi:MAG: hypothetical protein SGJ05_01385 [bacterium]|nr:hypothetical protein [bacterium]
MSDNVLSASSSTSGVSNVRRFPWKILLVCAVVLLPVLTYPFGQDHSTFIRGGRVLLAGGTLYVDYVDVKPPLIYVIFGLADFVAGSSVVLVRALEVVFQLITIGALLFVLNGITQRRLWLWISAIAYAVLYCNQGYSQVGQAESFCALPIVGALWCATQTGGRSRWLVLALCMTVAVMLKYTLGIIGPAVCIVWLFRNGLRNSFPTIVATAAAFIGLMLICYTPFLLSDGFLDGLKATMQYLGVYSAYPAFGPILVRNALKLTAIWFGDNLSITTTFLVVVAVALLLAKRYSLREQGVVSSSVWMFLALILTVILERKFAPYHFSRLNIPISFLVGTTALYWTEVRERFLSSSREIRWGFAFVICLLLVLSPLPRYMNVVQLGIRSIGNPSVYDAYLTRPELPGFDFNAIRVLRTDLNNRLVPSDRLLMMSMMATPLLTQLPTIQTSSFADSHMYFGTGATSSWRERAATDLRRANWVVVDTIDVCEGVNLHQRTSWQSLKADTLLLPILTTHFTAVDTVACFIIYKRVQS